LVLALLFCLAALPAQDVAVFPQLGHSSIVSSVAFSPDGKTIVSGSFDNTLKLWDAATGRELRTLSGHSDTVCSVAFSPDGRTIVSGSDDGTLKLWDAATGREFRTLSGHSPDVLSVAFSPDGSTIVSGSFDNTLKLWDDATGRELRTLSGHSDTVRSVAFSPDGKTIVSGSVDNTLKLWDAATGRELRTLSGHSDSVYSVAFSPDGKTIVSGSWDFTLKLWDTATGRELRTLSGHSYGVPSVAFSPDGRTIVSGSWNSTLKLWDAATGRELRTLSSHSSGVAFSPDGKTIVSGSWDFTLKLWDAATGRELRTLSEHSDTVCSVAFSPDGKTIVSGSADNTLKLWDVATGRELRTLSSHSSGVSTVAFSPDVKTIVSGSDDDTLKLWDMATGRELRTLSGHSSYVRSVAFSPDGKTIVSHSYNGALKLWDAATGRELRTLSGYLFNVGSVAFSPDGGTIVFGSVDSTIRLWNAASGGEIAQYIGFDDGEWLVVTPDGFYNASPNGDKYLNVRVGNQVYGIDQYRQIFYKPQIVEARLQGRPDPAHTAITIQEALSFAPPVVVIRSPQAGGAFTSPRTELSVTVVDQNQPLKSLKVLVNGRQLGGEGMQGFSGSRGLGMAELGLSVSGDENRADFRFSLPLDPGPNRIEVIAANPYSEGRDTVEVRYQAGQASGLLPNLWILSIGVNRYDDATIPNLNYAVDDAREIIRAFKTQEGKVYAKVNSLLIADGEAVAPTRDAIIDNLGFLKNAGQRDVVMLFIAGHGLNDDGGNFYFLPSDAGFNADGSIRQSRAIPNRDIRSILDVPGQKLVFIDACHSEGTSGRKSRAVENNGLVRELMDPGTVIFTSSRGTELSQEAPEYGHGLFTYALIEGIGGRADLISDGVVTIKELDTWVSQRVPELSRGQQHPTTSTPEGYVDFTVAKK
jgi:WD40 repeat protein